MKESASHCICEVIWTDGGGWLPFRNAKFLSLYRQNIARSGWYTVQNIYENFITTSHILKIHFYYAILMYYSFRFNVQNVILLDHFYSIFYITCKNRSYKNYAAVMFIRLSLFQATTVFYLRKIFELVITRS